MILNCGEALIDMIPLANTDGKVVFQPLAGGAQFNTAIGLGRLGINCGMVSGISNDMFGQQLIQSLMESRVSTQYLVRSDRPTTLAFVKLTGGQATYTFYDEKSAGCTLLPENISHLPAFVSCLCFGGISLIGDPSASTYCQLAERSSYNKIIMLDPNIRTSFILDEPSYRRRLQRIIAVADLIKLSDEDLNWLVPEGDIASKVSVLSQSSHQLVIVTRGGLSILAFRDEALLVSSPVSMVDVVDTVGAGDAFNSGLLASFEQQGCLSKEKMARLTASQVGQALAYAGKVAAVTVSRDGANPPWLSELG